MKKYLQSLVFALLLSFQLSAQQTLVYHPIVTDTNGNMVPWYNPNHGSSYEHCLDLIWNFWKNIPLTNSGVKYYMVDHTYDVQSQGNKIGGDQFAMLLSSWAQYYAYTGDTLLLDDMVYMADMYLANSLSHSFHAWPDIPYPCNYTNTSMAIYDGDFLSGEGVAQPDKAASFGAELVTLYKITGNNNYLQAAIKIANTLASKTQAGNANNSPYPFRVKTEDGSVPSFPLPWTYTGNMVPALRLFESLSALQVGNVAQYNASYDTIKQWIRQYPLLTNNWGSFFEDIPIPSNTEINAVTTAAYIMENPNWGGTWQQDARGILDWTMNTLGSHDWDTLGVTAIFEQTVDLKEGGSHTSRFGAAELLYAEKTGDTSRVEHAVRQMDWATYLVDTTGIVRFSPRSGSIWYTDGYGDFVRHYLRGMASYPAIAPDSANHLLRTSSTITYIKYNPTDIHYTTYDSSATEMLKLTSKPLLVRANGVTLSEQANLINDSWQWQATGPGTVGLLKAKHTHAKNVDILWTASSIAEADKLDEFSLYPNPANNTATVRYKTNDNSLVTIEVTDLAGKSLSIANAKANNGYINYPIHVSGFAQGQYLVLINANGQRYCAKMLVTR